MTRREFILSVLAGSCFVFLDLSFSLGTLSPAIAAVHKEEIGRFSGDIYFNQMHIELLGKKRDGRKREYRSGKSSEKIDILIVGGGISGLDTAFYLLTHPSIKRCGAVVRLFEMDDEVGGTSKEYE